MPAGQPGIEDRWRRILVPPRYIKINANRFPVPNIGRNPCLGGLKSNWALRMHEDNGVAMGWFRSEEKAPGDEGRAGASRETIGRTGQLGFVSNTSRRSRKWAPR